TRMLSVTREVNRLITTILDSNRLVGDVIEKIQQAFGYYHVQIYLYHPEDDVLRIAGATGETGTALIIGQHQLSMSEGLVGRAASTCKPVIVPDVLQDQDWLSNSLLPDTVSEIAVPIIWENKVFGVLDVQHNKPFDPSQNDINILQTVATQLGTALSNVKIFQTAQNNLRKELILNEMSLKLQVSPDIQSSIQVVGKNLAQLVEPVSVKVSIDSELLATEQTA
ncbi:MAG: GAF domain-containing protein, partial [Chloroflexota bacterium]